LEKDILAIMQGYKGDKDDIPVLVNENLSPELLKVLFEIFHTFDKDKDDCLDPKELDLFVFSTNGQHPPTSFIEQMGQRFGANEKGWLTKKGFLVKNKQLFLCFIYLCMTNNI
jgi:Ca2+-binding EF-hand superfamily protein